MMVCTLQVQNEISRNGGGFLLSHVSRFFYQCASSPLTKISNQLVNSRQTLVARAHILEPTV